MGQEAQQQVQAQIGLVDDQGLQSYVNGIGQKLAATSERPDLPWSYDVVDDPAVNAFALPGGFINVTRGILAYMESEAELAAVMGHETGHVTARHSVNQMSKQQLEQLGLGVGMIFSQSVRQYSGLLSAGLQLLDLKYSRDDETEADELGVRYIDKAGYDPSAMIGVMQMLQVVSGAEGGRVPEWQSTHPYPANREEHIRQVMQDQNVQAGGTVARDRFLDRIDGIVYGPDPREGYFKESLFLHPQLRFQIRFPGGWNTMNQKSAVGAISPNQDAIVVLQLAPDSVGGDPVAALRGFLSQQGMQSGQIQQVSGNGISGARAEFAATTSNNDQIQGEAEYLSYGGSLYQILGYGAASRWGSYQGEVAQSLASFAPVTDRAVLSVQPRRLQIMKLPSSMTVQAFHDRYATPVSVEELARLNRVDPGATIPAGTRVKRVVGDPLP